jgi:hypothetical protein
MLQKFKTFLIKPEILVTLISLGFTLLVSTVIGIGGVLITGKFWGYFLIAIGLQIIAFAVINTFLQRKDTIEGTKIINEQLEALSKFTVKLSCAYCQVPNTTPIQLNQENRFKCESCGQVNSIKMHFFTAQVTTPLTKLVLPAGEETDLVNPKTV